MAILIAFPWASFVVAAAFLVGWRMRNAWAMLLAAICWAAYGGYEYMMQLRWCVGECNIRVDLVLIYPILALASALALWRFFRP